MSTPILTLSIPAPRPELSRAVISTRNLLEIAARAVSNCVHDHFQRRNESAKHRAGFPRSNYWADAAASVHVDIESDNRAAIHAHAPGLRLHLHGGIVRPVAARALAIPLKPEVADINPREYSALGHKLFIVKSKRSGKAVLAGPGQNGKIKGLWLLTKSTTHHPDSSVLPPIQTLHTAIRDALP